MLELAGSKYTMEATTSGYFRVADTLFGDWVEIPAPLIGERPLQYARDHKDNVHIVTFKDEQIPSLSGRAHFFNRQQTSS